MIKKILCSVIILNSSIIANELNDSYLTTAIEELNTYKEYIHDTIVNGSSAVDNYFFDEKVNDLSDYYSSYGLIELSTLYDNDKVTFDQKFKLKLSLPRIRKKLNLIIETDEKRESEKHITNNEDNNLILGLSRIKSIFNFKIGTKINDGINPFVTIQAKKKWSITDDIDLILSQTLKESRKDDFESTSYFNISKYLNENLTLNTYNEYYWQDTIKNDSQFYHSIYLNQTITTKDLVTYQIDSNINNIDSNLKAKRYSGKIKYRHFFRNWLYTDIIQENYYLESDNFSPQYAIRFNLGILFTKN